MNKIQLWVSELKKMGLIRFINEKYFNARYKKIFALAGTEYPDFTGRLNITSAESLHNDAKKNQAAPYYSLYKAFLKLPLKPPDINFLDIGCGAGRALNFAMLRGCKSVTGVELEEQAVTVATQNCIRMQQAGYNVDFSITKMDAALYEVPENINTVYLFNPFGAKTLHAVLNNIIDSARRYHKKIYIIYLEASYRKETDEHPELSLLYESRFNKKNTFDVVIYSTNNVQ
ncbi:MAG TPA: class I SAM-dependent methyltransferase [Ferruginibacter sp.]|nr:class I SAM-dependent methyltransferase [Ferruginibacter sp.]HMP20863.1 class I SAM-dependent methyltransferase [Ferruginibacter sp.]